MDDMRDRMNRLQQSMNRVINENSKQFVYSVVDMKEDKNVIVDLLAVLRDDSMDVEGCRELIFRLAADSQADGKKVWGMQQ